MRYGEYYPTAKELIEGRTTVSQVLSQVDVLPLEDLFVEESFSVKEVFFADGRLIKNVDKSRYPYFALLVAKYGRVEARMVGGKVRVEPELDLDAIETVWYLPVQSTDKSYTYIVLLDGPHEVTFTATADNELKKVVARLISKRPVPEDMVRERAKAVILDHSLFRYFAQGRLL